MVISTEHLMPTALSEPLTTPRTSLSTGEAFDIQNYIQRIVHRTDSSTKT